MSDTKLNVPTWKKQSFERGENIHKFTSDFLARNLSKQPAPTRQEVDLHWTWQVMKAYPASDDPKRIYLLDQLSCPLAQILWEKREDEHAFKRKRSKQMESGFHSISRDRTKYERKKYASAAIMTHAVHGDVIVPDVVLYPLYKISYLDLVPMILAANPTKRLQPSVTLELWDAIITKIYDYEYDWRKAKKHEAKSATIDELFQGFADHVRSKKRKHSEVEDDSMETEPPLAEKKVRPASSASSNVNKTPIRKHSLSGYQYSALSIRCRSEQLDVKSEPMHIEQSQHGNAEPQDPSLDQPPEDGWEDEVWDRK